MFFYYYILDHRLCQDKNKYKQNQRFIVVCNWALVNLSVANYNVNVSEL